MNCFLLKNGSSSIVNTPAIIYVFLWFSVRVWRIPHQQSISRRRAYTKSGTRAAASATFFHASPPSSDEPAANKSVISQLTDRQTDRQRSRVGRFSYIPRAKSKILEVSFTLFFLSRAPAGSVKWEKKSARHNKTPCVSSSGNNPRGLCQTTSYITAAQLSSSYASSS
jgi:hypothetical protein